MKQIFVATLLLLLGGSSLLLASTEEPKKGHQLRLEVDGMTEAKGNLLIAIFDKEENYLVKAYTYIQRSRCQKGGTSSLSSMMPTGTISSIQVSMVSP